MLSLLTRYKAAALFSGVLLVAVLFFWNVFSSFPYLQHEIIGYAYWWNHPDFGFFETLFDGVKLDGGPGRFRYVEYIAEAIYWKSMVAGLLPWDLYDYFGIFSVFLISFLLFKTAKERKLSNFHIFLCLTFFILSSQSFLISVFHFRKAKAIIAIWFALIFWVAERFGKKRRWTFALASIGFLGFFTDPFFVVTAPVLVVCLDLPGRVFQRTRALLIGMSLAFIALIFINGLIGPSFNANTKLMFYGYTQQEAPELLSMKNVPAFPRVLQELLFPGFVKEPSWSANEELATPGVWTKTSWVGWLSVLGLLLLTFYQGKIKNRSWGVSLGLILVLPICSFLLIPISVRSSYSGYYGYPFSVVLTLVLMGFLSSLEKANKEIRVSGILALLLLICFHQANSREVFRRWFEHSVFPIKKELYEKDYRKFQRVAEHFRKKPEGTYVFEIKNPNITVGRGMGFYARPGLDGTDLLFDVIPLVFRKEMEKGLLKFSVDEKAGPLPPSHFWFSYALRFPHHLEPLPKGTTLDLYWRTANATECTVFPSGSRELNGGISLVLKETTTFRIRCTGPGGHLEDSFTAEVL